MPQKVLILDPDDEFAQLLAEQLGDAGLAAEIVPSIAAAEAMIVAGAAAALILAVTAPEGDAADFCRALRQNDDDLPVVLLGAASAAALETIGADEIFLRPLRLGLLITRLRQLIERYQADHSAILEVGPYRFEVAAKHLVHRDSGEMIRLTEKETAILRELARAGATPVRREQLLQDVWRYNPEVTTHTLETHIYRLRQKMETAAAPGPFLITESGGYRLAV